MFLVGIYHLLCMGPDLAPPKGSLREERVRTTGFHERWEPLSPPVLFFRSYG